MDRGEAINQLHSMIKAEKAFANDYATRARTNRRADVREKYGRLAAAHTRRFQALEIALDALVELRGCAVCSPANFDARVARD